MTSTPWGSDPNAPRQDGTDPASGGTEAPSYGSYDSGSSAPSYGAGPQGSYPQQGAYPGSQGYHGYGGGAPQGPPPSRTGAIITLVVGVLLMLGGPLVGFVVGGMQGVAGFAETATEWQQTSNPGTVDLPANTKRVIIDGTAMDATSDTVELTELTCTVSGPSGSPVTVAPLATELGGGDSFMGPSFTTAEAGSYDVACEPAVASLAIVADLELGSLAQAGTTILIGFVVGFIGLVATIVGIVLLVRANGRRRRMGY